MGQRKAVFLDLQGTLGGEGLGDVRDFTFYPFSPPAIRLLNAAGLLVVVVTNQSHISKGYFTLADFTKRFDDLKRALAQHEARLDGVYCCPHDDKDDCSCRKPRPGMLLQARQEWELDLSECYVVGDVGAWDVIMARSAGCKAVLVRTRLGEGSLGAYRHLWADTEADFVAENVLQAARWIIESENKRMTHG